jgi:hypothetical protein
MRRSIARATDRDLGLDAAERRYYQDHGGSSGAGRLVVGRAGVDDDVVVVISVVDVEPTAASDQHEAWFEALS